MDTEIPSMKPNDHIEGRPYRSHLHPACLSCRARKSRCKTKDASSPSCVMCEAYGTDCVFPQAVERSRKIRGQSRRNASSPKERHSSPYSHTRPSRTRCLSSSSPSPSPQSRPSQPYAISQPGQPVRTSEAVGDHPPSSSPPDEHPETSIFAMIDIIAKSEEGSSHVVNPAIADDDRVFQDYLYSSTTYGQSRRMVRFQLNLDNPTQHPRPILFNTVPKRGKREIESRSLAALNCEIIEKLIEPYQPKLINLYFEKVNMSFPIFDELLFRRVFLTKKDKISPSLLSLLYGNSLTYWNSSPLLSNNPCPEHRSIWMQAENAFYAELISTPGISTIISILLNVVGRPSYHPLGNGGSVGMGVALAISLGLNRDPSNWNLSPSEKKFRIRIWWLVLIYDRWCSLAYGTPPLIHRTQHDVPVPTAEDLCNPESSPDQIFAASCFVALTTLTQVLGHCLEHVYDLEKDFLKKPDASPFELETLLANWEDSLDDTFRRLVIRGTKLVGPGAANLRLAYLSVKLLIRRSQLDWERGSLQIADIDSQYHIQTRRVSEEIVDFVRELDDTHLQDFWIPQNAYTLTSATTFLMRSALNSRGLARSSTLKLARAMINALQAHRRDYSWDIADNCLSNCSDLVERIEVACKESEVDPLYSQEFMPFDMDMDVAALNGLFPGFIDTF